MKNLKLVDSFQFSCPVSAIFLPPSSLLDIFKWALKVKWWGPRELSGREEKLTLDMGLGPLTPVGKPLVILPLFLCPQGSPWVTANHLFLAQKAMSQIKLYGNSLAACLWASLKRLRSYTSSLLDALLHKRPDYSESTMLGGSQASHVGRERKAWGAWRCHMQE